MRGHELFELIRQALGSEAARHRGIDAPARRDTAIAGGSYRSPGTLVDGFRAGDGEGEVRGVVVAARASSPVLKQAIALGANLVITRQAFLGDSQDRPVTRPEPALAEKLALIESAGLMVLRLQDPRTGQTGRAIAEALPHMMGLTRPQHKLNLALGLIYQTAPTTVVDMVRKAKAATGNAAMQLIGDPALEVRGVALATETNRPNALNPLLAHPDVDLLIAGEVHETETAAYAQDAITLGHRKALLLVGSMAMEEPAARVLAAWLGKQIPMPVTWLPSAPALTEVA